ncbi:hypothetical protein [Clostridium gasigenes]|nr:hypothetical protein [Clostridium gasigenes]MBU3106696.1 hypothetical protein [Clostridium gasigenes]
MTELKNPFNKQIQEDIEELQLENKDLNERLVKLENILESIGNLLANPKN